jgi:hypothetical protein
MATQKSINVVNDGYKTIYLEVNSKNKLVPVPLSNIPTFELGDLLWGNEVELQRGWAYITYSPLKNPDEPFSIIVKYREGNKGHRHVVTAWFGANSDTPRSCITEDLGDRP